MLRMLIIFLALSLAQPGWSEIAVIVNANNGISTLESSDLKRIFLGKQLKFDDGNAIKLFSLEDSNPTSGLFYKKATNKSSAQFKAYWGKLLFTGKGKPPKKVKTKDEMIQAVGGDANAIGFLESAEGLPSSVKVVATVP